MNNGQKGAPRHRVDIVIHHMGAEPKGNRDGKSVRDNIEEAAEEVEKRDANTARTEKKIPDKTGGGSPNNDGEVVVHSYVRRRR